MSAEASCKFKRWNSLAIHLPHFLQRLWIPIAIVVLPLLGFYAERESDEPITGVAGPALYALYALGLIAYLFVAWDRLPAAISSTAVGVLGTGAAVSALVGVLGAIAALFVLFVSLPWLVSPRSVLVELEQFGTGLVFAAICLSPWLTSLALCRVSATTLRSSAARAGKTLVIAGVAAGVGLTIVAMGFAQKADADWLAPRLQAFEADDAASWERSLNEIKANQFCGHRRCLMSACMKLMGRFGRTTGQSSPFASPFGFAIEAPNVPPGLAEPFAKVYGYPVHQVCAVGD